MNAARIVAFTTLAMVAFAGNSLLCRLALKHTAIDAASFTTVRLVSGAFMLCVLVQLRRSNAIGGGNWRSAWALFVYAAAFSFAYVSLPAATGALLLFGSVQATMLGVGLSSGERLRPWQSFGVLLALAGLVVLLLPDLSMPVSTTGSLLMVVAGVAWGIYSLRGRGAGDSMRVTAGNFVRAAALGLALSAWWWNDVSIDPLGVAYAVASGAIASGVGYSLWYTALPTLTAVRAANVQLSVPVIAAVGGAVLLGEPLTLRMVLASLAILGGMALVIRFKSPSR